MKTQELRKLTLPELKDKYKELLVKQLQLRMKAGSGEEVRPHLFRDVRKDLARIKTLEKECQIKTVVSG